MDCGHQYLSLPITIQHFYQFLAALSYCYSHATGTKKLWRMANASLHLIALYSYFLQNPQLRRSSLENPKNLQPVNHRFRQLKLYHLQF